MTPLSAIDVAILAGGLGTRIRAVLGDTPKVLAPIGGRPFLDVLLGQLAGFGARRVVLCLGHLADRVCAHLDVHPPAVDVEAVVEPEPLGTGGALRFARPALRSDPVLVMNGDTWLDADLGAFAASHARAGVAVSILCVAVPDVSRYGRVVIDAAGFVQRYVEKDPAEAGPGVVSGGVYLFSRAALDALATTPGPSLERDFLPRQPAGTVHGFVAAGARFVDIGTPESLEAAARIVAPPPTARTEP